MTSQTWLLEQMGLGPVWTQRNPAPVEVVADHALVESEVVAENVPEPVVTAPAIPVVAKVAIPPVIDETETLTTHPSQRADSAAIAQMDWPQLIGSIQSCKACTLCETRTQAVPGVGDQQASLLVVGEAPGADEDAKGEPFVGRAGQLLDSMLAALGLKRGQGVYIANVLKCRPPNNRDPEPNEVAACSGYLHRQIALIKPSAILCVGRHAAATLLNSEETVGQMRGKAHHYDGIPLVVSYHPAYLLRKPTEKAKAWQDLVRVKKVLPS